MSQLSLWEEPQPIIWHHHIEVRYQGGAREIVCTGDVKPRQYRKDGIYAGFIGGAFTPDDCPICNPQRESERIDERTNDAVGSAN